jgi:Fur family transcriptional regulator, ferric uptake regulator
MTFSPDVPCLAFRDVDGAIVALRERGLRLSTPRRLVLEALFAAEGPVSAEHIARALSLDPTSVYRNLETLERHGIARHVHLGHGPGLYVLVGRGEREYLYCERCGAVRAVTPDALDPIRDRIRELFGYEARFTHFAIVGMCPACARASGDDASHEQHARPHTDEHEHPHSHGGYVHSHGHPHREGLEDQHEHAHL